MYHDTTTIFVFGAILLTFVGLLQVWLWEQDRRSHELGLWGVAHLLGGFGLALLVGRGLLPNRLSIDLGNAAIDLGGGLAWIGVRRFERRPAPISVAFVGAICWLIACQFDNFHNSPADRAGFGAVILGTYDALCVCEFLRRHVGGDLPSRRALAIIFAIDTVMNSIRLTAAMLQSSGQPALNLPGSQWFGWPAMLGLVCVAGTSVLQIAVAKEAAEQRSNAILAEARDTAHRTNLAKSRFLARMSHELRTPLNGVLGMAQTLTRDPAIRGAQRERAVLLEQSGRHLLAIISDILDLASVESGQFQLAPRPTLVSDVVQGSVDLVAETASMKQMTLDVEHDADVPTAVLADPLRVTADPGQPAGQRHQVYPGRRARGAAGVSAGADWRRAAGGDRHGSGRGTQDQAASVSGFRAPADGRRHDGGHRAGTFDQRLAGGSDGRRDPL